MRSSLFSLLFLTSSLFSECVTIDSLPMIYLCSRLTPEARRWNDEITREIEGSVSLFRPQDVNFNALSGADLDCAAYGADFKGMMAADMLLVLPPYGRDCAWEMGWFCGAGRPVIAYVEEGGDWLRDAMVKGGFTVIITCNPKLYERLLQDPTLAEKSILVSSRAELGPTIVETWMHRQNCTFSRNQLP
jgi:hypothetical protein